MWPLLTRFGLFRRSGMVAALVLVAAIAIDMAPHRAGVDDFDKLTISAVDATLNRTLEVFAVAKLLNSVLSVAKTVTIEASPMGVGASFSPGHALDPLDQIIDDLTNWMLEAITAILATKLIISASSQLGVTWLAVICLVLFYSGGYFQRKGSGYEKYTKFTESVLVILILARFGFPICMFVVTWTIHTLIAAPYDAALATLKQLGGSPDESSFTAIVAAKAAASAITENSRMFVGSLGMVAAALFFDVVVAPLVAAWVAWRLLRASLVHA
ncbi:MAG: hypothetical protein WCJ64_01000 [Rhodospirillaceae bacterium]